MNQPPREFSRLRHAVECGDTQSIQHALVELRPYVWHQRRYIDALIANLDALMQTGTFDFSSSRDVFDQPLTESLLLFPAKLANQSAEYRLECAWLEPSWRPNGRDVRRIIDVPDRFVPCTILDATRGFRGDCAVFFPEHIAARRPMPRQQRFALFFPTLEAERFSRVATMLDDPWNIGMHSMPELVEAFTIWDVLHDAAHDVGPLPLECYIGRGGTPVWVEAVEELRADILAYNMASALRVEGTLTKHVIVIDRAIRFPLTAPIGSYDSIAGQVMFGYLCASGHIEVDGRHVRCRRLDAIDFAPLLSRINAINAAWSTMTTSCHSAAMLDVVKTSTTDAPLSPWHAHARASLG